LQAENRQLRADLYRAQRQLVPHSPAAAILMLQHIYYKARDRKFRPDDSDWERVKDFADQLENVLSAAKLVKL